MVSQDRPDRKTRTAVLLLSIFLFSFFLWRSYRGQSDQAILTAPVVIEVRGDVDSPGIYILDQGKATISGALSAAGRSGIVPGAEHELKAGDCIEVLGRGPRPDIRDCKMRAAARLASGLKLDLNSVSEEDLLLIPLLRPDAAASIVKRREDRPWESVAALREIQGIGPKTSKRLEEFLEVPPPAGR